MSERVPKTDTHLMDRLADLLSEGKDFSVIAVHMGLKKARCMEMFEEMRQRLGWQAS